MNPKQRITTIYLIIASTFGLAQAEENSDEFNTTDSKPHSQLQKRVKTLKSIDLKLYQQLNFNSSDQRTQKEYSLKYKPKINSSNSNFGRGYGSGYGSRKSSR